MKTVPLCTLFFHNYCRDIFIDHFWRTLPCVRICTTRLRQEPAHFLLKSSFFLDDIHNHRNDQQNEHNNSGRNQTFQKTSYHKNSGRTVCAADYISRLHSFHIKINAKYDTKKNAEQKSDRDPDLNAFFQDFSPSGSYVYQIFQKNCASFFPYDKLSSHFPCKASVCFSPLDAIYIFMITQYP